MGIEVHEARRHVPAIHLLLRALLVVLAIAAVIGLGIVFAGPEDTVTRVLLSVLVLGGALLLAIPAALAPWAAVRWGMGVLVAIDAVLTWVIIWAVEESGFPTWVGKASAMIVTLLVVLAVALTLLRVTSGARLRMPRIVAMVSGIAGILLLAFAWAMIITDGDAGIPARVIAGVAIIYAATALGALVLALMRSYAVVRRS